MKVKPKTKVPRLAANGKPKAGARLPPRPPYMGRGQPPKYPGEWWFGLPYFTLRQGRDYQGSTAALINQIRVNACRRRLSILVDVSPDERKILVRVRRNGRG